MTMVALKDFGGSGGSDVERIHAMLHGDAHDVVGGGDGLMGQTVALSAHDKGQSWLLLEQRIVECDGIVAQRHGGGAEAQVMQVGCDRLVDPCPWH